MKLFLIGYMGVGKSYWGRKLANYWNVHFIDLDDEIAMQEKLVITDIFQQKGEIYFRQLEQKTLQQYIQKYENFVMACGGGTPCFYDNLVKMRSVGSIVWLNPSTKILLQRLQEEQVKRPLIKDLNVQALEKFIEQQIKEREKYYNQADIIINDLGISIEELAKTIQNV